MAREPAVHSTPSVKRRRATRGAGHLLRADIVAEAHALLEHFGSPDTVSMRAIAQRVGVTTPSIYLHFQDKQQLMQALAEDAFAELQREVWRSTCTASTPVDRLLACGRTYVAFALRRPEHYRLAFVSPSDATSADSTATLGVVQFLMPMVADYLANQSAPESDSVRLTLELWAMAHGVASLLILSPRLQAGEIPAFVERSLCATLRGSR